MDGPFAFDVFLSHSSKDKPVVRAVAERLRKDGLRVWFDEWEIRAGDSIPSKVEEGLERSRVLVLCMSANAFGSDWAQLESGTFRFRDPLNKERRFIPLRLDEAPIKGSLKQFLYIEWSPADREKEYPKLLEACRPPAEPTVVEVEPASGQVAEKVIQLDYRSTVYAYAFSPDGKRTLTGAGDKTVRLWDVETGRCVRVLEGHTRHVFGVAWSVDQRRALSGSNDRTLRLWDVETGRCRRVFGDDHRRGVRSVAWISDQRLALSGADDATLRLWDVETGHCVRVLEGHSGGVNCVAWTDDQSLALSGADDGTLRVWDVKTGHCECVLEGHSGNVWSVVWDAAQRRALSGSDDETIRLWDIETGCCLRILEGHRGSLNSLAWSGDQRHALSGSDDHTVRIWDVETGRCLRVLEGHTSDVMTVAWSADQCHSLSGDKQGGIRIWDLSEFVSEAHAPLVTVPAMPTESEQVQYTNAKVLLVGDPSVGKTGLSNYLAHRIKVEEDKPIPSTDGAWATHWPLKHSEKKDGVDREIWLWDFAGQVDYRLVHQLFMDETAAAVLVFNPQNENPFEGLGHWDRDLQKAARKPFAKLLAAGRIDRGGLVVSDARMKKFMAERGFVGPLHQTSAKTGEGCDALRDAIVKAIDWQSIPKTTSPALYHRMKQEILHLRDSGPVLIRLAELKQRMEMTLSGESFKPEELGAAVSLLAGPGMIQRVDFGGFILLRPEVLSRYAAAVVRKVRKHGQEMGCIGEEELLAGSLDYQDFERLPPEDERVVLRALLETFVQRAWCLRQATDGKTILTFPSYFRRERPEQVSHPNVLVTYRFAGPTEDIYATLVVRLHHTVAFQSTELWRSAADFRTQTGAALGFTLKPEGEGSSLLEVYFAPEVEADSQVVFLRYVHDHLAQYAQKFERERFHYCGRKGCKAASKPFADRAMIAEALAPGGSRKVFCPACGKPISLRDAIEVKFESPAVKEQVREIQMEVQAVIDNESRELMAVHHTGFIVAEAGQIYRGYTNSDHGIDGEIEFKDDGGRASGKRLYVQLKSGDSYLRKRQRDEAEVFDIKNPRWADYWQQQAYAVMLVVRGSDGEIRWMDVSAYLKRESAGGKKAMRQVVFEGERMDVMSVRRWRERVLRKT